MFADDPWTLPAYSVILNGTARVSDEAQIISAANVGREIRTVAGKAAGTRTMLESEGLDTEGSRMVTQNWTVDPVSGPEKLQAIRGAFLWVLYGPGCVQNVHHDDYLLLRKWPGPPCAKPCQAGYYFGIEEDLQKLQCYGTWLHQGCRKDVPHDAVYKAHCGGRWVWVGRDGMPGLTAFTLIVQKVARTITNDVYYPKPDAQTVKVTRSGMMVNGKPATLTATLYVDCNGNLTAGPTSSAYATKSRLEPTLTDPVLRSQINAAAH